MYQEDVMKRKTILIIPVALVAMLLGVSLYLVDQVHASLLSPPQKVAVFPPPESHTADVTTPILITYDQDMDPLTVNPQTFAVHARQTGWLTDSLSVSGGTIRLDPLSPLHAGELVQVSATTQTLSLGGEGPITPTVWQFTTAPWSGNAYFHYVQTLTGANNRDIALGDLDGDGDLDMLTSGCNGGKITIFHNDGNAIFTQVQQIIPPGNACSLDVELGDLDGDGDLDIFVVAGGFNLGSIRTWLNDGSGSFTLGVDLTESNEHIGVALGDLNDDGYLDAFSAVWNGSYNKVWLNDRLGGFSEAQTIPNSWTVNPLLGDLNGDSYPDIYLPNMTDGFVNLPDTVWLNDGTGHFTDSGQVLYTPLSYMPALGDLDADGDLDVYLPEYSSEPDEVWLNDGLGNFSLGYQMSDNDFSGGSLLGDLDSDGDLDAVTANPGSFFVLLNSGWLEAEPMPEGFGGSGFVQCPDDPDSFYLVGGAGPDLYQWRDEVYKYDVAEDQWSQLSSLPQTLFGIAATCYEGKIYAAGGWRAYAVNTLYVYDIATDTWTAGANLPRYVSGAALGAWDGKLYLVGGSPVSLPSPPIADVDIYDIQTNTWSAEAGADMPMPAAYPGWVQRGAYLYVVGGLSGDYDYNINATQRYDLSGNTWQAGPNFTSQRALLALAVTEGHLYAIGGDLNGSGLNEQTDLVESLDLSQWPGGSWTDIYDPIPQAVVWNVGFCTEAISGGEIWSVGGDYGTYPNYTVVDTNLYRPTEPCVSYGVDLPEPWQEEAEAGETVTYTLSITNTGVVTDYFTLEVSATWGVILPPGGQGPVEPGQSIEIEIAVEVPSDAMPGDQGMTEIIASSLSNWVATDITTITTTVIATYAVDISPESLGFSGFYGEIIPYTLTVTNIGNISDTVSLTCTGNTWEVLLPVTSLDLGVEGSADVVVYVTIPVDAWLGDSDVLILTATSVGDPSASDSSTLTTTAIWYRQLLPMILKN
jgi:hypothetical protein